MPTYPARYGVGVNHVSEFSPRILFQDGSRQFKRWTGGTTPDANGYPTAAGPFTTTLYGGFGGNYPAGVYTVIGAGLDATHTITVSGDATAVITASGQTFTVTTPSNNGLAFSCVVGVTGIHIALPGFAATYATDVFHPDALTFYRNTATILRMMDPMVTNLSPKIDFADDCPVGYYTWNSQSANISGTTTKGVPISILVKLANDTDCDIWVNIPHRATDAYVTALADYIRDNLDTGLKCWIEYSNEIWNSTFQGGPGPEGQYTYCQTAGAALGYAAPAKNQRHKFQAQRSGEIFDLFEASFGGLTRLVRVMSGNRTDPDVFTKILAHDAAINAKIDYIAIAMYFGTLVMNATSILIHNPAVKPPDVDTIFSDLAIEHPINLGLVDSTLAILPTYGTWVADKKIVWYEGGQSLQPSAAGGWAADTALQQRCNDAQRDQRMYSTYLQWLEWSQARGFETVIHYSDIVWPTTATTAGRWGLWEYMAQPNIEAPKYVAWTFAKGALPPPTGGAGQGTSHGGSKTGHQAAIHGHGTGSTLDYKWPTISPTMIQRAGNRGAGE